MQSNLNLIACLIPLFILFLLAVYVGFKVYRRNRLPATKLPVDTRILNESKGGLQVSPESWPGIPEKPQVQFAADYTYGDAHLNVSFGIEMDGEYLGECGLDIAENLEISHIPKVSALEAWIFDKSEIRTICKELVSEYAYRDTGIRNRLSRKGEVILLQPGLIITLETKTILLRINTTAVEYADQAENAKGYFQKVSFKLAAWCKPLD